mmetsp:Transcript_33329/g.88176  ORF Transcript_33329/g.88176 Transcript_33329/m.88176 type:complete len:349 (-) Transcript_33329:592-1638(-)
MEAMGLRSRNGAYQLAGGSVGRRGDGGEGRAPAGLELGELLGHRILHAIVVGQVHVFVGVGRVVVELEAAAAAIVRHGPRGRVGRVVELDPRGEAEVVGRGHGVSHDWHVAARVARILRVRGVLPVGLGGRAVGDERQHGDALGAARGEPGLILGAHVDEWDARGLGERGHEVDVLHQRLGNDPAVRHARDAQEERGRRVEVEVGMLRPRAVFAQLEPVIAHQRDYRRIPHAQTLQLGHQRANVRVLEAHRGLVGLALGVGLPVHQGLVLFAREASIGHVVVILQLPRRVRHRRHAPGCVRVGGELDRFVRVELEVLLRDGEREVGLVEAHGDEPRVTGCRGVLQGLE